MRVRETCNFYIYLSNSEIATTRERSQNAEPRKYLSLCGCECLCVSDLFLGTTDIMAFVMKFFVLVMTMWILNRSGVMKF